MCAIKIHIYKLHSDCSTWIGPCLCPMLLYRWHHVCGFAVTLRILKVGASHLQKIKCGCSALAKWVHKLSKWEQALLDFSVDSVKRWKCWPARVTAKAFSLETVFCGQIFFLAEVILMFKLAQPCCKSKNNWNKTLFSSKTALQSDTNVAEIWVRCPSRACIRLKIGTSTPTLI